MLKGNEKFGGYKATFSVLENNLFNCFAKMVTYTLFKKQTDNRPEMESLLLSSMSPSQDLILD